VAFEFELRGMDGENEVSGFSVVGKGGSQVRAQPNGKVIETIASPLGNRFFDRCIKSESEGVPASGSFLEPGAKIGGEESIEEDCDRLGHEVSLAGGGSLAALCSAASQSPSPVKARRSRPRRGMALTGDGPGYNQRTRRPTTVQSPRNPGRKTKAPGGERSLLLAAGGVR
jgi:hypothetical protein